MIYLAQPYTHKDPDIMELRYKAALRIVADYTRMEFLIYSPIVHYHNVAKHHNLPCHFDFWRELNLAAISRCTEVWVLPLKNWEKSLGVKAEVKHAEQAYKQITYLWEDARRLGV